MNTSTDTMKTYTPQTSGGRETGQSATDKIGFYGTTPVTQPTNASQAAVTVLTDTSGGTAHLDTGLQALTSTYNSGILANALSSLALAAINNAALTNRLRADLVTLGLIKGS